MADDACARTRNFTIRVSPIAAHNFYFAWNLFTLHASLMWHAILLEIDRYVREASKRLAG
jgi:hypothetical protein